MQSKLTYGASGAILFGGTSTLVVLLFMWIGWWSVAVLTIVGVLVGISQWNSKVAEKFDAMVQGYGISKH